MSTETQTETFTAGALMRRAARLELDVLGIEWVEHKRLLYSVFVITGTEKQFAVLARWIAGWQT